MMSASWCRAAVAATVICLQFLVGPVAANDSLLRFQQELLPRLQGGALSYESVAPLGARGFVLENVAFSATADGIWPGSRVNARRIEVEELDFDSIEAGRAPHYVRMAMLGVVEVGNRQIDALRQRHNVPTVPGDMRLEYRFDPAARTLVLGRFEANTPGLSRLSLEATLDNLPALGPLEASQVEEIAIRSAGLTLEGLSGLRMWIGVVADLMGKQEDKMIREWQTLLAVVTLGKRERTQHVADTLVSFLDDYRQPAGPLHVRILPISPRTLGEFGAAWTADDPAELIGFSAVYPGTRRGAAAALLKR